MAVDARSLERPHVGQPGWRSGLGSWVRFNRMELGGAFGDIGTDLPLLAGMILASGADSASVLIVFGLMQVVAGLAYGIPMPVQPLKAVAVLVIAHQLDSHIVYGGGLAIGAVMLLLTTAGAVDWLARAIPTCVVRGIQFGLGLKLALLALTSYMPADGPQGWLLAAAALAVFVLLRGQRRVPAALVVVLLGALYAMLFRAAPGTFDAGLGFALPQTGLPSAAAVVDGFLLLALAQLPLSLGNSVLATHDLARDLFPERRVTLRKIGLTYSLMNLVAPLLGGFPVCHGCGGMAGHYAFGARTGGSAVLYGLLFLVCGVFVSGGFAILAGIFPLPLLGAVLLVEATMLLQRLSSLAAQRRQLAVAALVGLAAAFLPYGFLIGMAGGTLLAWWPASPVRWSGRAYSRISPDSAA